MPRALDPSDNLFWRAAMRAPAMLYGRASALRAWVYRRGLARAARVPAPVICIGNLTVGGTGKTPAVIFICEFLLSRGRKPAILTRGYGRARGDALVVVSDGAGRVADVRAGGDEPCLMARRLPTVPIVAAADRATGAETALQKFSVDTLVMDDGFQHFALHRDLDIVCIDATDFSSLGLNHAGAPGRAPLLLPAGRLREPLSALSRADLIFLTKAQDVLPQTLAAEKKVLARWARHAALVTIRYGLALRDPAGQSVAMDSLRGRPVLALSGLARPAAFENALTRAGAQVTARRFPDHHHFSDQELAEAAAQAKRAGALIVTTEKDAVRLPPGYPAWVARLVWTPDTSDGSSWTQKIDSVISSNTSPF